METISKLFHADCPTELQWRFGDALDHTHPQSCNFLVEQKRPHNPKWENKNFGVPICLVVAVDRSSSQKLVNECAVIAVSPNKILVGQ